jgi:dTDP-4-amino-4,6-dideoxygalactose transaminase
MKLAINGGEKLRAKPFPAYNTIDEKEEEAVLRVLRSGKLSTFLGTWHNDFHGGKEVVSLEEQWSKYFGVKHSICMNSATSCLFASVGAIGINSGDEVIVTPYSMSATATAILLYGGIPVFADIEEEYFCLDPKDVEKKITSKTKAIMIADIFGGVGDFDALRTMAKKHNLKLIEDCAQAPFAKLGDDFAGTLGDVGIFSLNYHKHIHCGEGGIVVTNDDDLALKLKLIRNHSESVIGVKGYENKQELNNMLGFNFRMTEIEASIAKEQLKKLKDLAMQRVENVKYLEKGLSQIPCLKMPKIRANSTHTYYVHPLIYKEKLTNIHRDKFIDAIKAELPRTLLREDSEVLMGVGYVKPIYKLPIYKEKICFGKYPFNLTNRNYENVKCNVCEDMHYNKLITHEFMRPGMKKEDLDDVINAFVKVWENIDELKI